MLLIRNPWIEAAEEEDAWTKNPEPFSFKKKRGIAVEGLLTGWPDYTRPLVLAFFIPLCAFGYFGFAANRFCPHS
ncbi:hypothetical protein F7725_023077 [Dissostichus mawsoni]|uniref:Uncharacterized protein n=1 Tax=Dissostichus mawsoni TaxID=36200 RepID=A0A7J5YZL8_DISMA|nr:hypothetical protein F7725_023077 [Dissostichus mawsoni]